MGVAAKTITSSQLHTPALKAQKSLMSSILSQGQCDDVHDALYRFFVLGGKGKLFTNSTGTGKTYLTVGVLNSFIEMGLRKLLVVAPSDKILNDWKASLKNQGIDSIIAQTEEVTVEDNRIVLMTFASFRQAHWLFKTTFNLIAFDESHHLMSNSKGEDTNASDLMKALTGHKNDLYKRASIMKGLISNCDEKQIEQAHQRAAEVTKVLLLSATPFASHKCLEYAEGLLFDYGKEPDYRNYNTPSAKQQFYIDHFGYFMKNGRLNSPPVEVDTGILERKFHQWLVSTGALSYRGLNIKADYSRDFILVDSAIGAKIDSGMSALMGSGFSWLASGEAGIFNKLRQKQLLESIKAIAAVNRAKLHLQLGRKVIVYHSFLTEKIVHPFHFERDIGLIPDDHRREYAQQEFDNFKAKHPELCSVDISSLKSVAELFSEAFGDQVGFFNGTISKTKRSKTVDQFNQKGSGIDILVVQERAGREGLNLNDAVGDCPRVLMQIGMPSDAVACIQIEGRTRRYTSKSNAIYEYFNTGTDFEISTFAQAIATKSELVENLATGPNARNLKQSFVTGYLNSSDTPPSLEQGKGGLEADTRTESLDIWGQAKSRFFSVAKKNARSKSVEGNDFYATPAPVGLFMTMLAKLKAGDSLLEPSAGLGDIAMWCPANVSLTCVEQSFTLFERLQLNVNRKATFQHKSFEDYYIGNKHKAIVMNPPFGHGGKLAAEHVEKACRHLKGLGRVVALIPDSEQMENRLQKSLRSLANEEIYMKKVATYSLPTVTFSRAATLIKTKIVVLVRAPERFSKIMDMQHSEEDFSYCDTFEDIFEALKDFADCNLGEQECAYAEAVTISRPTIELDKVPVRLYLVSNNTSYKPAAPSQPVSPERDNVPRAVPRTFSKENQLSLFG